MVQHDYDIMIVGAGLMGLSMALALADTDWSVCVIDGAKAPTSQTPRWGRVNAYHAETVAWLTQLGVWPNIDDAYQAPFRGIWVGQQGRGHIHWEAEDDKPLGYFVPNDAVLIAMRDQLLAKGVPIHWQTPLDSLVFTKSCVQAEHSAWSGSARLVLGADGARSRVREVAGIACETIDHDQQCLVGILKISGHHESIAWQRFLPTGPLGLLPLNGPYYSLAWSVRSHEAARLLALDDKAFLAALNACDLPVSAGRVLSCEHRQAFPLISRHASRYDAHRLALMGDAAHAIHPLAGLGANMGFRDVKVLASLLRESSLDEASLGLCLRRYHRSRRAENAFMMHALHTMNEVFQYDHMIARSLRALLLAGVQRCTGLKALCRHTALSV